MIEEISRASYHKRLGVYYTPEWLARPLVDWAIDGHPGRLLDPSFGGCAFLRAGLDKLESLAVDHPGRFIYGCDLDEASNVYRERLIGLGVPPENLRIRDFLSRQTIEWLGSDYTSVVGNPPYIRHQVLSDATIARAQELTRACGAHLPRLSSAWAYFTILSAERLQKNGRLAMILPGAILQADYGRLVIDELLQRFGTVRLLHNRERIFATTEEESVILLASDRGQRSSAATYSIHDSSSKLLAALSDDAADIEMHPQLRHKFVLLDRDMIDAWQSVRGKAGRVALGEVADVRIGVVTGCNEFFVRRHDDALFSSRHVNRRMIISKNRYLSRPTLEKADMIRLASHGRKTSLAIIKSNGTTGSRLRREIDQANLSGISMRSHCARRDPWYRISDLKVPDLFMPYMGSNPRGLVVNNARALSTNAIHRVYVRSSDLNLTCIAESTWSGLFAFESELFGRSYGGTILKLEPHEAAKISVGIEPRGVYVSPITAALLRVGQHRLWQARMTSESATDLALQTNRASKPSF